MLFCFFFWYSRGSIDKRTLGSGMPYFKAFCLLVLQRLHIVESGPKKAILITYNGFGGI